LIGVARAGSLAGWVCRWVLGCRGVEAAAASCGCGGATGGDDFGKALCEGGVVFALRGADGCWVELAGCGEEIDAAVVGVA